MDDGANSLSPLITTNHLYVRHLRFEMHQPFAGRLVGSLNGTVWEDTANLFGADIAFVDSLPFRFIITDYSGCDPNGSVSVLHRHVSTRRRRQLALVQPCHAANHLRGRVQRTPRR